MKNESPYENEKNFDELNIDNELDLIEVFKGLLRNKNIILPIVLSFSGFGLYESTKVKDIWQGQFQIVLENTDKKSESSLDGLERLSAFMTSTPTSDLKTNVAILKSPSVLMPVLDYLKNEKKIKENNIDNLNFKSWVRNSLTIELEDSTTILNIDYKDTDKDLIIPVLEKISKIYQEYSTKQMKVNIEKQKGYLKDQIEQYNLITQDSILNLQKYSEENDILIPSFDKFKVSSINSSNQLNNYLLLMNNDNDIKYKIEETKQKLNIIENNNSPSSFLIISNGLNVFNNNQSLIEELQGIERNIQVNSTIFKKNDPLILKLEKTKNSLVEKIKTNTKETLKAQLEILKNIAKNNSRSNAKISKFREYFGAALRNSITLQNLEKELHFTLLQEAKTETPWKLITNPTLFGSPVGPFRLAIFIRQIIIGLFIGSTVVAIFDIKKNVIYSESKLRKIVNFKLIERLSSNNLFNWGDDIKILINGFIKNNNCESLVVISLGNINDIFIEKIDKEFQKYFKKNDFLLTSDILGVQNYKNVLLIVAKGSISRAELTKQINRISLQKINLVGWILIG